MGLNGFLNKQIAGKGEKNLSRKWA